MKNRKLIFLYSCLSLAIFTPGLATSQGIEIESGSSIVVSGTATIEINSGSLVNNGNYTKGTEAFTMSGTSTGTISGDSNTELHNLVVTNTGGITTQLDELTSNNLTLESGAKFTISAGKAVEIKGNLINIATGEDFVIQSDADNSGSLIIDGSATGNVTYNRYLLGNAWHMISSPSPGQSISDFLTANTNIPTKDVSGTDRRGMMDYDEANNVWYEFFLNSGQTGNLKVGKGFSLRTDADGIVSFTGALETGTVNANVSRTAENGWNCVGNPFPSAIFINDAADADNNFIDLNSANLDPSYAVIYVWEQGNDAYSIVSLGDPAFYAQAGQGFFVKAKTGATQIQFTHAMQSHQPSAALKSGSTLWPEIKLTASKEGRKSTTRLKFNDEMTAGLDIGYDAGIFKTGFDIYTQLVEDNGVAFGLQSLPMQKLENIEIPVGLDVLTGGEIIFSLESDNFPSGTRPVLNDNLLKTKIPLTSKSDIYKAVINENTKGYGRFSLTFTSTTGLKDISSGRNLFRAWYNSGFITITGEIHVEGEIKIYDVHGRILAAHKLMPAIQNRVPAPSEANGIYIVRVKDAVHNEVIKVVKSD